MITKTERVGEKFLKTERVGEKFLTPHPLRMQIAQFRDIIKEILNI
jgi:hypothetical protein